jgi:hypothetical protein
MTNLSTTGSEKPPAEVVDLRDEDDEDDDSDDDDLKKNIYNEIPEYDDVDEVKLAVESLDIEAALRRQNAANENLYSEIQSNEERFENALYMAANNATTEKDEKQKAAAVSSLAVFPSMSPKTRSFYPVGAPLPSIPSYASSTKIPEEKEPSWCCGTRRRRRRNLVLGLVLAVLFLLFLCIALLVRMYVPPAGDDQGFQGGWNAAALKAAAADSAWMYENRVQNAAPASDEPLVLDDALFEPETAPVSPYEEEEKLNEGFENTVEAVTPKGVVNVNGTSSSTSTPRIMASTSGFDEGISTAEFLQQEAGSPEGGWEADNQILPTTEEPRQKTFHSESICTSWQGRRKLVLTCPIADDKISVVRSYYGWSKSETVCNNVASDTYCRTSERDTVRCNGRNECSFWADASGWMIGCHGLHDYLQVDYYCVPS